MITQKITQRMLETTARPGRREDLNVREYKINRLISQAGGAEAAIAQRLGLSGANLEASGRSQQQAGILVGGVAVAGHAERSGNVERTQRTQSAGPRQTADPRTPTAGSAPRNPQVNNNRQTVPQAQPPKTSPNRQGGHQQL